jgi:hypothetical protein
MLMMQNLKHSVKKNKKKYNRKNKNNYDVWRSKRYGYVI